MLRIRCMLAVYRWSSTKSYIGLVWGLTGRCFSWLISQFQPLRHYGWVWVGLGALLLLHKMHVSSPWNSSICFTVSWLIFQFQPLQFFTTKYFLITWTRMDWKWGFCLCGCWSSNPFGFRCITPYTIFSLRHGIVQHCWVWFGLVWFGLGGDWDSCVLTVDRQLTDLPTLPFHNNPHTFFIHAWSASGRLCW